MKVSELIGKLGALPQDMDVTVWEEASDDWIPVTDAIWEDGCTEVNILSSPTGGGETP